MADIDIQPKKRPIWPWIVGILAAIIIVWIIVKALDKNRNNGANSPDTDQKDTMGQLHKHHFGSVIYCQDLILERRCA